jgi:H+/Cl- antiporter ClcA
VCALAGLPVAFAIVRLPGNGGHVPAHGLQVGSNEPNMVPGIALAAFASLGLGLVLGPEAPLIAIGAGVAVFTVKLAKRDAPPQLLLILGAAGSFAAISVIFGSPIVAAVLVIEASGLGGAMLPLILIPGLISAGIGSLVFVGMADWTGLDTSAYSLVPLQLPSFAHPTFAEIGWTIVIGVVAALLTEPIRRLGLEVARLVPTRAFVLIPAAGLAVGALALLFAETTDKGADQVLFSGQEQLPGLVDNAGTYSLGVLAMIILCKGLAWGLSLGSFRGGPTFPAVFLGAAGGIAASHLPAWASPPRSRSGWARRSWRC